MDRTSFGKNIIAKWEKHTGCLHQGKVDLDGGNILPYWDHRFVEDLLNYTEKLYERSEKLRKQMKDLHDELTVV